MHRIHASYGIHATHETTETEYPRSEITNPQSYGEEDPYAIVGTLKERGTNALDTLALTELTGPNRVDVVTCE